MSDIREYLSKHIEECRSRIETIRNYVESHKDADSTECRKNIEVLQAAIAALQEKKHNDELRKNGRLVELPCAVNDILYTLVSTESGGIIEKAQVKEIELKHRPFGDSVFMLEQLGRRGILFKYYESDFGKSVFYTQEEAETELTNREEQCDGN